MQFSIGNYDTLIQLPPKIMENHGELDAKEASEF